MFAYMCEHISNVCIKSTLSKVSMNTMARIVAEGGRELQSGCGDPSFGFLSEQ